MINIGILTISDKSAQGERPDRSGQVIREMISRLDGGVSRYEIVPDDLNMISNTLAEWADGGEADIIITTGGTGLGKRDFTPEATLSIVDKVVPGIPEAMRAETSLLAPFSILSRAEAGIRGSCLIINLPGSPKAVAECLEVILPTLTHATKIIKGHITEHNSVEED